MIIKKRKFPILLIFLVITVSYLTAATPTEACESFCDETMCGHVAVCSGCPICTSSPPSSSSFLGRIELPSFFEYGKIEEGGLGKFLNNIFILITAGAGIFALFNFIMAGYAYMSSNGDEKKIEQAWSKIWQSVIGLTIVGSAFLIAALAGWILFDDPSFILKPKIYGPN